MMLPSEWPRQPFIGIAIAALVGIFIADQLPQAGLGVGLMAASAAIAVWRRSSSATYVFVAASFFALHSTRQTYSAAVALERELGLQPQAITARGVVVTEPKVSERGTSSFLLRLASIQQGNRNIISDATLIARWRGEVRFGDELQLFGVIQPTQRPRNPGEFDMREYLARLDVRQSLLARYPESGRILSRGNGSWIMHAAHASRQWMQSALARGLEDSPDLHGLISGMVLGVRDDTPDEIEEQFQQTGTLHLFAVSGLNVAIVAQLLWTLAAVVRVPRRPAIILTICGLFFYAAITGLNTSSVRAALMAAVLLAGYFAGRKVLAGNSVAAAAVLVLVYDTNQLFSIGFRLSFAVVIAIMLLADPFLRLLMRWCQPDPFLPRSLIAPLQRSSNAAWGTIARGASVSIAAWLGSLPFILPYFHLLTPIALIANLIVVPLAFFVLAVGLMSLLVTPALPWLALVFNNANWALASAILLAVDLLSRAPAGHFYVEAPGWQPGLRLELNALDAASGAALHVRARRDDWLWDTGGARDYKRILRSYLRSRGVNSLDGVALTHGDAAHIGAAIDVFRAFRPREFVDTAAPDRSSVHRMVVTNLDLRGHARQLCATGDEWRLTPDVTIRVLFPPAAHRSRAADDQALVTQIVVHDRWRVLLMSDSGEATERLLLSSGADLQSDVVIKGQHHSGQSGSVDFFERVQPSLVVTSSPVFPEYERVKEEWTQMVRSRGIKLMRQDETGAVTLRFFRDRWEARPYLTSEIYEARADESRHPQPGNASRRWSAATRRRSSR
ncbi:MAG: ComEC/Rec2 family competence protein [Chthoniobacterales bacterium]|nr:ComEC/Rec2 family competence protein [Chthoniobacterales bacterium]